MRAPTNTTVPLLLYVDGQPDFDDCMKNICVDQRPDAYGISWLQSFNLNDALAKQKLQSKTTIMNQLESALLDVRTLDETVITASVRMALADLGAVIQGAGDGWLMGSGSWFDPCLDRLGIRNTIIAFGVFFTLVGVIIIDGIVMWTTGGEGMAKMDSSASHITQCSTRCCQCIACHCKPTVARHGIP